MRFGGQCHGNRVAHANLAARQHDPHHAGLEDGPALAVAVEHGGLEALPETIDLSAWRPQTGQLDHGGGADLQPRADGEIEQVDAARGDVLAHLSRRDGKALGH